MCDAIQEGRCHLGTTKNGAPLFELEIGRKDDRRCLVKFTDQVKEQPSARFGEWDVAQLVHDNAVGFNELLFNASGFAVTFFFNEQVDEVDAVKEPDFPAVLDKVRSKRSCDVGFSRSGSTDEDQVVSILDELSGAELVDLGFLDRCFVIIKGSKIPVVREPGCAHSVMDGTYITLASLCLDKLAQRFG